MAIALDTYAGSAGLANASGQKTQSITIADNSDRLLLALVTYIGSGAIESVKFNGVDMTLTHSHSAYTTRNIAIYYLVNPPTGSHDLVLDLPGSTQACGLTAVSFYGVDQTDPIGNVTQGNADNTSGNSFNLNTSTANSVIVGAANYESSTGNLTIRAGYSTLGVYVYSHDIGGMYRSTTDAGDYEAGFTHTSVISMQNVAVAIEIKPVDESTERTVSASDNLTVSESVQAAIQTTLSALESLNLSENVAVSISAPSLSPEEQVTLSEAVKAVIGVEVVSEDQVNTSESVHLTVSLPQVVATDNIEISESVIAQIQTAISEGIATEHITLADIPNITIIVSPVVSDTVELSETVNITLVLSPAVQESIEVSESVQANIGVNTQAIDTIQLSENVTLVTSNPALITEDLVSVGELALVAVEISAVVQENINVTEALVLELSTEAQATDSIGVVEDVYLSTSAPNLIVSDTITLSDSAVVLLSAPTLFTSISDTVNISESVDAIIKEVELKASRLVLVNGRLAILLTDTGELSQYKWL